MVHLSLQEHKSWSFYIPALDGTKWKKQQAGCRAVGDIRFGNEEDPQPASERSHPIIPSGIDLLFPKVQTAGETGGFLLIKGNKPGVSSITWSMQGCCKFKDLNSLQSGPGPRQLISLIYGF